MKKNYSAFTLLIFAIVCGAQCAFAAAPAPAPAATTQALSNTLYSNRNFRVTWQGMPPENANNFTDTIYPRAVAIARDILGTVPTNPNWFQAASARTPIGENCDLKPTCTPML